MEHPGRLAGAPLQGLLHPVCNCEPVSRAGASQALNRPPHVAFHVVLVELQFDLDVIRGELEPDDRLEPCATGLARVLEAPGLLRANLVLR